MITKTETAFLFTANASSIIEPLLAKFSHAVDILWQIMGHQLHNQTLLAIMPINDTTASALLILFAREMMYSVQVTQLHVWQADILSACI